MRLFRRKLTDAEFLARVHNTRLAENAAAAQWDLRWEAKQVLMRESRETRELLLAAEVERLRAEMGLPSPVKAEIATPDPAPVPVPVKVPKARKAPKVSPATVEPLPAPALVSAEVAQAAPVAASPAIAAEAPIAPERPRKVRKVAAKTATVAETVTVPLPITVREPCGVETVWQPRKGSKAASLGIVFK